METVTLTKNQVKTLKDIINVGKADCSEGYDRRSIKALEVRGLVKVTENKKGTFATATAKGKKLN